MNTVKKFFALSVLMLTGVCVYAQTVTVASNAETIYNKKCSGYSTELAGTMEEANASLNKYLKPFGKVKVSGNQYQVTEPQINLTKYTTPFFASVKKKGDKVEVWMGAVPGDSSKSINDEMEKLVYNFGVKFYKDKIQADIDESTRAQLAAEKRQQRLTLEGKNMASRLEMNSKEKTRLVKSLATNRTDSIRLATAIAQNKKSLDSLAAASEQIKKMVEAHKERQRKVN